ncbi:MAG: recombination protein O N-terminal domain-containing protein, partial [Sediminibacterium sp.]|nr:recombination protein O N-terminal domain-containing protein [Sediminibacterium sp.]
MLFSTKGIVLKVLKFSETTIIATIYTYQLGLQQYKIPGIRKVSKKGISNAVYFQPAAILNLEVYNNENKKLQYIKDFSWGYLYHYT